MREFSKQEFEAINNEIAKFKNIGAIHEVSDCDGQFISNIFVVPKPNESFRLIVNLKPLNQYIDSHHFKMEDFRTVTTLLQKDDYMASIDLLDAYLFIPIHLSSRKYLRFRWRGKLFEFSCLCFGLSVAPRVFTKVLKPVLNNLRSEGHLSSAYLDDLLLLGIDVNECDKNVTITSNLLSRLGWIINVKKSEIIPSRVMQYLGFVFNSENMTISLPQKKRMKVKTICNKFISGKVFSILEVAELIGYLISVCPAVYCGQLYVRQLEMDKTRALTENRNNFNAKMILSADSLKDLCWWLENIENSFNCIRNEYYDAIIVTDASPTGWGATAGDLHTRGFWSINEKFRHINQLELLAIYNSLLTFKTISNISILVRTDNSTALSYINNFGGCHSPECHRIAKNIWELCLKRKLWIRASYISTKDNFIADSLSRESIDNSDYKLNSEIFKNICTEFATPKVDCFTSHLTRQLPKFYSWYPDPQSSGVDAFTMEWKEYFYAFPPFNLVGRVLKKILHEMSHGIVVVPYWPAQPWFPLFLRLCKNTYTILESNHKLLFSPYDNRPHPLWRSLRLAVAQI